MLNNKRNTWFVALSLIILLSGQVLAGTGKEAADYMKESNKDRDKRMEWFREARFGMFIHWGLYAVPAGVWKGQETKGIGEWIMCNTKIPLEEYSPLVKQFNPVKYDADEWVRIAKDAGMKYIVITSKHHDGFCLWDSKYTDYDMASTPYGKDLLKPLAKACKKHGITLCFYHSIMDWQHPNYEPARKWDPNRKGYDGNMDLYVPYMKKQLKELVDNYGPLGIMWFDGEWESTWTHERGLDLYNYVRSLQPNIIVNNRVDKGRKGMHGFTKDDGGFAGDYGTPEQQIPAKGIPGVDWESCMTMNGTWGYKKNDHNWKSSTDLIQKLIDIASKGGNFLLNVGPTGEGLIPEPSVERLADMGKWMKVNSESIYGTTANPIGDVPFGRITAKENKLYLHVFNWPKNGKLVIPGLDARQAKLKAYMLANGNKLNVTVNEDKVLIDVDNTPLDPVATVIVLNIKGSYEVVESLASQESNGVLTLLAENAKIHNPGNSQTKIESKDGKSNIGYWIDPNSRIEWTFKINKAGKFKVEAEVAQHEPKSKLEVIYGKQKIATDLASTGSYDAFKIVKLGELELKAGKGMITLKPNSNQWKPINLRRIVFKPLN